MAAGAWRGGQVGEDAPGHDGVGGVAGRKYIAALPHLVGPDLGGVVRAEAAHADLGGAHRDVQQQQRGAERQQRPQRVLPPGAPAQPGRDHHRRRAALSEDHVVVEVRVDLGPLLVGAEEHELPVQPDQPARGDHGHDDGGVERQRRAEQRDPVPAHARHMELLRPLLLTVQPGEQPVQTGEVRFGTHSIDVTGSEWSTRSNLRLCDDHVMWHSSQRLLYPGITQVAAESITDGSVVMIRPVILPLFHSFAEGNPDTFPDPARPAAGERRRRSGRP